MITVAHKQEQISKGYIIATAAAARVNLSIDHEHDYGIDGTFNGVAARLQAIRPDGTEEFRLSDNGIKVDFQLKCTTTWEYRGENVSWSIKSQTYNDLVLRARHSTPLILILMCLPRESSDWVTTTEDTLILRHCCYFVELEGAPLPNENSTKKIEIPRQNVLTPAALSRILVLEEERKQRLFA